jgi:hypothetical protein
MFRAATAGTPLLPAAARASHDEERQREQALQRRSNAFVARAGVLPRAVDTFARVRVEARLAANCIALASAAEIGHAVGAAPRRRLHNTSSNWADRS